MAQNAQSPTLVARAGKISAPGRLSIHGRGEGARFGVLCTASEPRGPGKRSKPPAPPADRPRSMSSMLRGPAGRVGGSLCVDQVEPLEKRAGGSSRRRPEGVGVAGRCGVGCRRGVDGLRRTRARPGRRGETDRRRTGARTDGLARTRLPIGPCSPTLPRSANSRSRPNAAAPRHIRGDPRAGSVRAERPSTGHRCRVLSLLVALRGEYVPREALDAASLSTVPRSRRLGNRSRPPDAP